MKSLLILYPIWPYVNSEIWGEYRETKKKYAQAYQQLISARYPDFQITWMMFSEMENPEKPDMSYLWSDISIKKDDIVGACGVNFNVHCQMELYPDPKTILGACPQPIEKLVIGGFHFWDCVDRVAECAHNQGIDVLVDDDLTEFFFHKISNDEGIPTLSRIPLSRKKSIEEDRKRAIETGGSLQLKCMREARKNKPWLLQI